MTKLSNVRSTINMNTVHPDLEEKFKISADIDFDCKPPDFEGMQSMEVKVKIKKTKLNTIENVELGKSTRNSIF